MAHEEAHMLGCAFFVTLIAALMGELSWWVVLGIGSAWIVKKCVELAISEGAWSEANPTKVKTGTEIMRFGIQAGLEIYSHQPLAYGVQCKIVVQGTDDYLHSSGPGQGWGTAKLDAVYLMGEGQYVRHESLLFDRQPAVLFAEDPHQHCYSFLYCGTGRHLSVLLGIPPEHKGQHAWPLDNKPLQVSVRALTETEEAAIKTRDHEQQREEAEMRREELSRQALELATLAYVENNFLDEQYRQHYATKHTAAILKTLGQQWRAEYLALMSNEALYALVQEEHPHVMAFLEARLEVVRIAQRLAVEPAPPPTPEPKSRLTPEEWAARIERYRQRSLTRKRVKFEDHRADVLQDLDMLQEFVDDLGQYPLDEDERERLIQEFKERLLGGEEDSEGGFKQL
jgi:hypothetical protein